MSAELEKAGKLEESVYAAQERTSDLMDELLATKLPYQQAWELAREEWAFLPSEQDQPELSFDPASLSESLSPESRANVRALRGRPESPSPAAEPTTTASPSAT